MSELNRKVEQAIKLLRTVERVADGEIELSYSGGKDSDVILTLARMAGIKFRAIYKNTTIDPSYTIRHCINNGVEIVRPKKSFFQIIEQAGYPSRWSRFCCRFLKEYKILDTSIQGIRRAESVARAKRYKEPIVCHNYGKGEHVNVALPILDWTNADISEFVNAERIQCHPLYYNDEGKFCANRRLGCIGCPMQSDNGLSSFIKYPKMVRAWLKAGNKWFNKERAEPIGTQLKFNDVYELFTFRLFFKDYESFRLARQGMFGKSDCKQFLEDYFKIDLTL